jgi:TRAP-type uncharacterized transport system substrate-binding protein
MKLKAFLCDYAKMAAVAAVTLLVASQVHAQQLKVATGSAKGTYSTMLKELNSLCATEVPIVEVNTNGSMTNVDLLTGNQVNGAWVQSDVLYFRANNEDLSGIKTLLAMHLEEVHFVALRDTGIRQGGVMGTNIGAKRVTFENVMDLGNYKVGAVGGSYITAQVIRLQSEIPYTVVSFEDNDKLMAALNARQIEAAVFVGGQPLGAVAALGPEYRLLNFTEHTASRLKGVYRILGKGDRPITLNYPKMNSTGVRSIAVEALFVTREYKTPKIVNALGAFRTCAQKVIPELQETTGSHPKWQAVMVDNKGKWAWYDLPAVPPPPPVPLRDQVTGKPELEKQK